MEKYEKGIEIANKYPDNKVIQSQLMTIYTKTKKYDKAIKIAEDNPNHKAIQSQLITLYMTMGRFYKAEKEAKKHPDYEQNQSLLMTIYTKQKRFDEAIEIGENNPDNEIIQYKLMISYIKIGKFEKAKLIAYKYPKNRKIQNQLKNIKDSKESDDKIVPVKKEYKVVTKPKSKKSDLLISKKKEKNDNSECKTTYDLLDKKYKEAVFGLKVRYYFDMSNIEKRASAIYKYDRLDDVLNSKPSEKNLELLLLMLVGDMKVDIQKDYPQEYSKVMKRIETKIDELRNNTTL